MLVRDNTKNRGTHGDSLFMLGGLPPSSKNPLASAMGSVKLQILIPHYHETADVIKPLLDSIAIQQGVDLNEVGVIICHDGEDIYPLDIAEGLETADISALPPYPFQIEQIKIPHGGVSAARNALLDRATADYVMYCDCDDCFSSVLGLYIIFENIEEGFDSLVSAFLEESHHPETKKTIYLVKERDNVFVHGKVHKRQYLIDKNIRWNEALTIHEDSYFNTLCQTLSENVIYVKQPFYLWKWREASVCRHDPKYRLKTYNNLLDSNDALVDEFLRRDMREKAEAMCVMIIFDSYYTMNKPEWVNQENREYRDSTEQRFKEYFRKHKDLWESIDQNKKMVISNNVRTRLVSQGMQMETMTIEQWLNIQDKG